MSKFMFFDFRCEDCQTVTEEFVKPDIQQMSCSNCPGTKKRLISAPSLGGTGTDPTMPTLYDKWERTNKQKVAQDRKFFKEHGVDKKHHSCGS